MDMEKNIIMMVLQNSKENIKTGKDGMEMEKNIIINLDMKENIIREKNGMERNIFLKKIKSVMKHMK